MAKLHLDHDGSVWLVDADKPAAVILGPVLTSATACRVPREHYGRYVALCEEWADRVERRTIEATAC